MENLILPIFILQQPGIAIINSHIPYPTFHVLPYENPIRWAKIGNKKFVEEKSYRFYSATGKLKGKKQRFSFAANKGWKIQLVKDLGPNGKIIETYKNDSKVPYNSEYGMVIAKAINSKKHLSYFTVFFF